MLRIWNKRIRGFWFFQRKQTIFQRIVVKTRSDRESLWDSLLQLLFTAFPIHEIPSKNYDLGKHSSDDGLPAPKCLKNVEPHCTTINEFIFVVKPWVDFTPEQCATMCFSLFSAAALIHAYRGISMKLLFGTICLHKQSRLKV